MSARDIMTWLPVSVLPEDSVAKAARTMRERGVGLLPVVDSASSMHLVGVITDRDITVRCVAEGHAGTCAVRDHMTRTPLHTVDPGDGVDSIARKMEMAQVRRVLVVEPGCRLVGIVSQADIAMKIGPHDARLIEEVVESISKPVYTG